MSIGQPSFARTRSFARSRARTSPFLATGNIDQSMRSLFFPVTVPIVFQNVASFAPRTSHRRAASLGATLARARARDRPRSPPPRTPCARRTRVRAHYFSFLSVRQTRRATPMALDAARAPSRAKSPSSRSMSTRTPDRIESNRIESSNERTNERPRVTPLRASDSNGRSMTSVADDDGSARSRVTRHRDRRARRRRRRPSSTDDVVGQSVDRRRSTSTTNARARDRVRRAHRTTMDET